MANRKSNKKVVSIPGLFREYEQTTSKIAKEVLIDCAASQAMADGNAHLALLAGLRYKDLGNVEKSRSLLQYAVDKGDEFALVLLDELCA